MNKTLRSLSRPAALAVSLLGFSLAHLVSAAETYSVNLTTPWKAGQAYTLSATGSQTAKSTVKMGPTKAQEQTQQNSATLEADAKALEAWPDGGLRKAQFTVRSFRAADGNAPAKDLLPKGAVIVAEKKGEEVDFTVDGQPASTEQANALKMVVALDEADQNDQLVFGTNKPVAVGETWRPDPAKVKAALGKDLGEVRTTDATMRLDSVAGRGDAQVAMISGDILFDGIHPPLPPGLTLKSGKFQAKLTGKIPAQRKASTRNETLAGSGQFVAVAPGPTGEISLTVELGVKQDITLTFP